MKRAPQSAVGARASKMSSLQLGSARIPDSGRGDGAELLVTPARAFWRTNLPSRLPRGGREKLPQAVRDSGPPPEASRAAASHRAQYARSAPSVPRACRRSWVEEGRRRTSGWGMGAHTAASNPSHSVNTPFRG